MKKINIVFQTTELSDSGHKIIVATDNEKSEDELFGYFQEAGKLVLDSDRFRIGKDMIVFEEDTIQKESNRKSKNILILLKKHIGLLSEAEVTSIKEICRDFPKNELPSLKKQAESFVDEKHQSIVKSDVINGFEKKLLDNIPALNKFFKTDNKIKFNKRCIEITIAVIVVLLVAVVYKVWFRSKPNDKPPIAQEENGLTFDEKNMNGYNNSSKRQPSSDADESKFAENSKRQQTNSRKESKPDLTFIDDFCKKNECKKSDLLPIIEKKIGSSELNELSDEKVFELKSLFNTNSWAYIYLTEKEKESLKKFFNLDNNLVTIKSVQDIKIGLKQLYSAYTALIAQKDCVNKYVDLFKAVFPDEKERLAFVVTVCNSSRQTKIGDNNSIGFNQFDCEIIEIVRSVLVGKESLICDWLMSSSIRSEIKISSDIANCKKIKEFSEIYCKKLQKIINTELTVESLKKKFMDIKFEKLMQNSDFAAFYDSKKDDENITKADVKKYYLNEIINNNLNMEASAFEEQLAFVNKLYNEFLDKLIVLGDLNNG